MTIWERMRWQIGKVPKTAFPPAPPRPVPLVPVRPVVSGGGVGSGAAMGSTAMRAVLGRSIR
jgi:hypothetical protein